MADLKVALLDRRFGTHGGKPKNTWKLAVNQTGEGNTFAYLGAFSRVMTGSIERGTDYSILKDYDLVVLRVRDPKNELVPIQDLRNNTSAVILAYCDEWVNYDNEQMIIQKFPELSETVNAVICGFGKHYQEDAFKDIGVTNFHSLPYASDIDVWRKYFTPLERRKGNYITGMYHIRSHIGRGKGDKIHTKTLDALAWAQREYSVECKMFLNYDGHCVLNDMEQYASRIGLRCEFLPHMHNDEFYKIMSQSMLFIEEYPTPAHSRATVVAACTGTPQISTYYNEPSRLCYPDSTIHYDDWNEYKYHVDRLLTDDDYWTYISDMAFVLSHHYSYWALKDRVIELYDRLK
jgi:hypothetical protein